MSRPSISCNMDACRRLRSTLGNILNRFPSCEPTPQKIEVALISTELTLTPVSLCDLGTWQASGWHGFRVDLIFRLAQL